MNILRCVTHYNILLFSHKCRKKAIKTRDVKFIFSQVRTLIAEMQIKFKLRLCTRPKVAWNKFCTRPNWPPKSHDWACLPVSDYGYVSHTAVLGWFYWHACVGDCGSVASASPIL